MGQLRKWLAVFGVLIILGCGAAVFVAVRGNGGTQSSVHSAPAANTTLKPLTPADVNQFVQGLLAQAQQVNSADGSKSLSNAQASQIVEQQLKQLGINPPPSTNK